MSRALSDSLLVFTGAGLGGVARYWIGVWYISRFPSGLPWATIGINVLGSLLIGIFMALFLRGTVGVNWRLLVAVGVLGGFTTFSTFAYETVMLWRDGQMGLALANVAFSNVLAIGACALGFFLGSR